MATYDVIVIGARCAGSPTAMLLARKGYRVLLVDKATFPSDTISTHVIHPPGVAALERWGLLDRVEASGCPPIATYSFDFGPLTLAGHPHPADGIAFAVAPRRTVLDEILVRAAEAAGAEVREDFVVEELVMDGDTVTGIRGHGRDRRTVTETAGVVVGADGKRSAVARAVGAQAYHETPQLQAGYYAYWSDLPVDGFEVHIRAEHGRGWAAIPTNDGLTCVVGGWPFREFAENRKDYEGHYLRMFDLDPSFAERIRAATRETPLRASGDLRGFFRTPFGPGWALVGDAGYNKDFITAQGISDAFRDAELCASAIDDALSGRRAYDEAMGDYHATRDAHVLPMYEFTLQLASLEEPPDEMQQLLGAMYGNQAAMDGFARMNAGVTSPAEFLAPENVERIFAAAGA